MMSSPNPMTSSRNTPLGIFYSLLACFYWGIVFVIPSMLGNFPDLDIVLTRYSVFGICSLITVFYRRSNIFKTVPFSLWKTSTLWAFLINIVYYFGIAQAVRYSGSAVTVIIAGLAPIAILFYSNLKKKVLSYPFLLSMSGIIVIGIILSNISEFQSDSSSSLLLYLFGLGCVTVATSIWAGYIICNHDFLERHPQISPDTWCHMLGISSLIICLPLIILGDCSGVTHVAQDFLFHTPLSERFLFILLCSAMGIFSSSRAIAAWNKASLHLSTALLGALLIFEPIFGWILSYVYKQEIPTFQEGLGFSLMLGASICLLLAQKKANEREIAAETVVSSEIDPN